MTITKFVVSLYGALSLCTLGLAIYRLAQGSFDYALILLSCAGVTHFLNLKLLEKLTEEKHKENAKKQVWRG